MDNIEDTNNHQVQLKDNSPIDLFLNNKSFVFVYKKTEKLATALYMITNLFPDAEPMKWTLRSKVSSLLSFVIGFKDILQSREEEFAYEVNTRVLEIVSLFEIAHRSGIVSPMNFSILKSEFMNLIHHVAVSSSAERNSFRGDLQNTFFEESKKSSYISPYDKIVPRESPSISQGQKGNVPDEYRKTNRQNIIVNLMKKKGELVIQDIAKVISDCSEKTIQRELITLIDAGIVKRAGERRWSKYSLVEAM